MQLSFSCLPETYDAIEATLAPPRLARYLPSAGGDKQKALRLYVWNARICEALYLPLQIAEVASRNAISMPVRKRFKDDWYTNQKFINLLPPRHAQSLASTVKKEASRRGPSLNQDHIIAGLPFGFFVSLMTKSYENHLWAIGINQSFPNALKGETRESLYLRLDQMRHFRNSVAHHYAIFDRNPQRELLNALTLTQFVCKGTHWLSKETSGLTKAINDRPKN